MAANRSVSNKPLSRKQRVLNRGYLYSRSDDAIKTPAVTLMDMDSAIIHYFEKGGSGADVRPLKNKYNVLAGLRPDSQRYFDHHHAENDTFDAVNKRELELGAATMTSLIYLYDKYGLAVPSDNSFAR